MANGDIAQNEAGFTTVKSTDDIRLGYDRINEVADLAVRRGIRAFPTLAALRTVPGLFVGAIAATADKHFRWDGDSWEIWSQPYIYLADIAAPENGTNFDPNYGLIEAGIHGGWITVNFSLYRNGGGMVPNTAYFRMNAGYRPAGTIFGTAHIEQDRPNDSRLVSPATVSVDNTGGVVLRSAGGLSGVALLGSFSYRIDR